MPRYDPKYVPIDEEEYSQSKTRTYHPTEANNSIIAAVNSILCTANV